MGYFRFTNGQAPYLSDTNLLEMQKGLMELAFPIGSRYTTQDNTNPCEILGFGTWERFKGVIPVGLDENDSYFNEIGKTGGETEHALTASEIQHTNYSNRGSVMATGQNWGVNASETGTVASCSAVPHNNMPPYEVVGYEWIRRA